MRSCFLLFLIIPPVPLILVYLHYNLIGIILITRLCVLSLRELYFAAYTLRKTGVPQMPNM